MQKDSELAHKYKRLKTNYRSPCVHRVGWVNLHVDVVVGRERSGERPLARVPVGCGLLLFGGGGVFVQGRLLLVLLERDSIHDSSLISHLKIAAKRFSR